jgi:hypothetical protein
MPQYEVHEDLHLESQSVISISRIKEESIGDSVEPEAPPFPILVLFVDAVKMPAGIVPLIQPQALASASSQQFDQFASRRCVLSKETPYRFQAKGGVLNFSLTTKHPVVIFIHTGHNTSYGGGSGISVSFISHRVRRFMPIPSPPASTEGSFGYFTLKVLSIR